MYEIINSILRDLHQDMIDRQSKMLFVSDLEKMIEVMEDLQSDPLAIPTNSWDERQIIMSHIVNTGLSEHLRGKLFERVEYALSKSGVKR